MSPLILPTELLRIIAMNLSFEDLFHFQDSSPVFLAATSDVSFYCSFVLNNYYQSCEIECVFTFRDRIPNWREVVGRFMMDNETSQTSFTEILGTSRFGPTSTH
jgi:hypothetical protein